MTHTRQCSWSGASRLKSAVLVAMAMAGWMPVSGVSAATAECPWVWSPVEQLNVPGPFLGRNPLIRMDDAGTALAAWAEMGPDNTERILVSRRAPGGHWQAPWQVGVNPGAGQNDSSDLDLAVGASGHALLTWRRQSQRDPAGPRVVYFDPVAGWTQPTTLPVKSAGATAAAVAVNGAGQGLVSWAEPGQVLTRFFSPGKGWSAVVRVGDTGTQPGSAPRPVINDVGDAAVSWMSPQPKVARYDRSAGGWQPTTPLLDAGKVREGASPDLALTPAGDLFAVWAEQPKGDSKMRVLAAHYLAGQGWEPTARLSGASYGGHQPSVAVNPQGEAMVSWRVEEMGTAQRVESSRYMPGRGWGAIVRIRTDAFVSASVPSFQPKGEFGVLSQQAYPDDDGVDFSKVVAYTMRASSNEITEDAIWDLGTVISLDASPTGRQAALGATHDSLWVPSPGALRASVRERSCAKMASLSR